MLFRWICNICLVLWNESRTEIEGEMCDGWRNLLFFDNCQRLTFIIT